MDVISAVIISEESISKVKKANLYFWLSFLVYSLSFTLSTSDSVNYIYCQLFQILGLLLLVPTAFILFQWKFDTTYLKTIFIIYAFWTVIVILRGFHTNYQFIKFLLFDATFGIFLYFVPLVIFFPRDLNYYKKIFDIIIIFGIFYIIYDLLFIKDLLREGRNLKSQGIIEYFSQNLSFQSGFLLLTFIYHTKKRRLLALAVILLTFLLAAIRARRSLMFVSVSILTLYFLIYYYSHKVKVVVLFFSFLIIIVVSILGTRFYNNNREGLFGYITERMDEQTRSGVVTYFYNDMQTADWIAGKGIEGQYYCPGIDNGVLTSYRGVIETGYLQIILKGGLISLVLLLLIAIPAMIKGIFNSKNILSKAAGLWILLFLIDMYPLTPVSFSMNYILVWISIGICYSKTIRETADSSITEIFSS